MKQMTLRDALYEYRARVSIHKKGYAQEFYRIERIAASSLCGDGRLTHQVTSVDIATYRDARLKDLNPRTGKPISPATVRLELSLLSSLFDIGRIEWGICDDNPVQKVRKPNSPPGRERRLTAREERQILKYAFNHQNPELYSIIVLALETAMRQGEILGLTWDNIKIRPGIASLPDTKNGTRRDVPLSLKAREALIRLGMRESGRVFTYKATGLKSTWRFMLAKLKIEDLHFHDLRHEAVSRLFELGTLDMMEVAAISGHKSLSMLKRYTHLKASRLLKKLEGGRSKGRQVVLTSLVPYPAVVRVKECGEFCVTFPDLDGIESQSPHAEQAIAGAQSALLRHLVNALRESRFLPKPHSFLTDVDERTLVIIDPLDSHQPQSVATIF